MLCLTRMQKAEPLFAARIHQLGKVFALFLGGCALSLLISLYIRQTNLITEQERFRRHADQIQILIASRLEAYANSLSHTRALVAAMERVDIRALRRYIQDVNLLKKYPGTLGIGYIHRVKAPQLAAHIRQVRRANPGYRVWPEGKRDEYFPIMHYEPENESNRKVIGFDASVWPNRREAQDRAIATGLPAATEKIVLVRDMPETGIPGFVLFVPLFRPGAPVDNPEQRKEAVIGMFNTTFRASTFFEAMLRQNPIHPLVVFDVYDGNERKPESTLYRSGSTQEREEGLRVLGHIEVGGRPWVVDFQALPGFSTFWSQRGHWIVLATGTLISLLVSWLLWGSLRQREIEHELVAQVRRALDARDEFISIASHELLTPITSIKLQLELAERYGGRDPLEALGKITRMGKVQVARLTELINDLLDVTRIQSGKMKFKPEAVDLSQLAREVTERHRPSLEKSGQSLELLTPSQPVVAEADPFRLSQAMDNLVSNAIKYGNGKPIRFFVEKTDTHATVKVQDHGIGIPKEKHAAIFARFERVADTESVGGLGLGLYITKQVVDAHHGRIQVESAPAAGSTFTIELPLHEKTITAVGVA
jgi:two-component system, OmpR family, sensor kinase